MIPGSVLAVGSPSKQTIQPCHFCPIILRSNREFTDRDVSFGKRASASNACATKLIIGFCTSIGEYILSSQPNRLPIVAYQSYTSPHVAWPSTSGCWDAVRSESKVFAAVRFQLALLFDDIEICPN